jgi:hypothetical protein
MLKQAADQLKALAAIIRSPQCGGLRSSPKRPGSVGPLIDVELPQLSETCAAGRRQLESSRARLLPAKTAVVAHEELCVPSSGHAREETVAELRKCTD